MKSYPFWNSNLKYGVKNNNKKSMWAIKNWFHLARVSNFDGHDQSDERLPLHNKYLVPMNLADFNISKTLLFLK